MSVISTASSPARVFVVRTSPVKVEFDLLLHVPTRSVTGTVCACTFKSATPESSSAASPDNIVRAW
jgi:hypothetical protein